MRVLVTGGAGFIGSALVRHLVLKRGAEVLTLDKLTYAGNLASLRDVEGRPNHRFVRGDIADRALLAEIMSGFRPDRVMHLAAESHVDRSITGAGAFIQTNIVGTYELLEASLNYWRSLPAEAQSGFRFHHVSTDEVFGSLGDTGLFHETTAYDPSSPYSASKAASDHLVMAWHRTFGLPVVLSNCSNNYGPYHFPEKLIPLNILNALEGRPIIVYGAGANVRDWLHVEDHARALDLISSRGLAGRSYNVGGRNERSNLEVVHAIARRLDHARPDHAPHAALIRHVADRPGHDKRYAIDATRLEQELGWKATHDFESGLDTTVAWYLANEWWWRPLRDTVYGGERLGLAAKGAV